MSKELQSIQFNNITWRPFQLGENTILLEGPKDLVFQEFSVSCKLMEQILGDLLVDIVPAYTSVALFSSNSQLLLERLDEVVPTLDALENTLSSLEIPICYELGLDLELLSSGLSLSKEEIIDIHLNGSYSAAFIGFTPGFVYIEGLDERLHFPRRGDPRKLVQRGSIGIGGSQTGIYSLDSPGGWNIIGRTPLPLFDIEKRPPMLIELGTKLSFVRISETEFEKWGA